MKRSSRDLLGWILAIAIAIVCSWLLKAHVFYVANVPTSSMEPTIEAGSNIFILKAYNKDNIKRGDILSFYSKELDDNLLKRVIALPGDKLKIIRGVLYVNSHPVDEKYVNYEYISHFGEDEIKIPEGKLFFLGDNRPNSFDSRYWEDPFVDIDAIIGKAMFIYLPRYKNIYNYDHIRFKGVSM